ncbi:Maltodextrin phosphorylase [Anaerococcus prevotii]|uniref:Alpha-1,4 glucan phosphorylase n=1 Tax=Anaerococcus prevotii (strain ATCC 9321 / DSM 20548 / JCM 6508 / NCTC 11806 / PC1) TaxID=525919 RepID=C7RG52_ANAPD|nr:glycogen/starch/alpha-glucan phosphorylase [Anaerococcus prevotii]ACV28463.1 glycogen/starch/alpha-glucan phosphorylase [Anaerococcus prevotii DSM 20548]SUU94022.1 Maltodextrin phosphorylase [Anaerococcus prevotii]
MDKLKKNKFIENYVENLQRITLKSFDETSDKDRYNALCDSIMELINEEWRACKRNTRNERKAYYLSAEFLIGRSLGNNLINLGIYDEVKELLDEIGIDFEAIENYEDDAALGNGGLGRLAACFMDSAATQGIDLVGYGVRYREGIFKQKIEEGFQVESGDSWIKDGDGWSIRVDSDAKIVKFRDQQVKAVPFDMPVVGFENGRVNTLRLWQSEPFEEFDFAKFNNYEYDDAVAEKNRAEDITRVLYPNDMQRAGKVLRLKQQYFFCSASIQDMIEKYKRDFPEDLQFKNFSKYHVIQLNDTHPIMAIPELIRVLVDENGIFFEDALKIARKVFAFTNHTVLQEALERWDKDIVLEVSPRCLEIIEKINEELVKEFKAKGYSEEQIDPYRIERFEQIHMANLAIYVGFSVNGVAALHTEILKADTFKHWYKLRPEMFNNKTNGITPRRWLVYSNRELSSFITEKLGTDEWKYQLDLLKGLEKYKDDEKVLEELWDIKQTKKNELAKYILDTEGVKIDPESIFDIQIKRIHEYKRQHLNVLHIIYLYHKLKKNPDMEFTPTTFIFGGKAAPGYFRAKGMIKLANEVARVVNADPDVNDKIKVVFVENYRVSYAEKLFPAADISEQISTAGKEASGTGNMKFMLNGALTLGTLDGANIEIFEHAGEENNFRFGATVEELNEIMDSYNPVEYYSKDPDIKDVVDSLVSGEFKDNESYMFLDIYNELIKPQEGQRGDNYFLLKDFKSYAKAHERVNEAYKNKLDWSRKCLINIANAGFFSSDRTILDYAADIWKIDQE